MEDDVGVGARHDVGQLRRLNVGTHEGKSARAQRVAAKRMLEVGGNARAEVVDSNYLVAVGQETVDQSGPDEPGGAGYEGSHHASPKSTSQRRPEAVNSNR